MEGLTCVDAIDSVGGLCPLWKEDLQVNILNKNVHMIHVKTGHEILPSSWQLTFVYGPPTPT